MAHECPVCREFYTIQLRKEIRCPHCPFVCCVSCLRQFILSSATEPACMSCKVQFNYEFLLEILPRNFWHKDYKEFRKTLLLAREEALLPETQTCITHIHQKDQFWKYIEKFRKKMEKMRRFYHRLYQRHNQMVELIEQERQGNEIPPEHPLFLYFHEEDNTPMLDERGHIIGMNPDTEIIIPQRRNAAGASSFIHACPSEDCRGYLRGEQSRCPICQIEVCPRCLQTQPQDHECKKEDLDTVELLRKNTRPCPSCSMSIYKISGCDQMWCTQCKTPFSWKTGQKINQTIHNPHYYEWMNRNRDGGDGVENRVVGRELMDIPCGGLPTIDQLRIFPVRYRDWVCHIHRWINHCEHVTIPASQRICEQNQNFKDLRITYLLNGISKENWKIELYRREKNNQKHLQYVHILQTFVAVSSDWLRRMVLELIRENIEMCNEIREMTRFFTYINEQITRLNLRYKSSLASLPANIFRVKS